MKLNYNNGFDQDEIDLANSAPDLASLLIWDFYPEQVGETSVHHFRKGRSCGSLNFVHLIFFRKPHFQRKHPIQLYLLFLVISCQETTVISFQAVELYKYYISRCFCRI